MTDKQLLDFYSKCKQLGFTQIDNDYHIKKMELIAKDFGYSPEDGDVASLILKAKEIETLKEEQAIITKSKYEIEQLYESFKKYDFAKAREVSKGTDIAGKRLRLLKQIYEFNDSNLKRELKDYRIAVDNPAAIYRKYESRDGKGWEFLTGASFGVGGIGGAIAGTMAAAEGRAKELAAEEYNKNVARPAAERELAALRSQYNSISNQIESLKSWYEKYTEEAKLKVTFDNVDPCAYLSIGDCTVELDKYNRLTYKFNCWFNNEIPIDIPAECKPMIDGYISADVIRMSNNEVFDHFAVGLPLKGVGCNTGKVSISASSRMQNMEQLDILDGYRLRISPESALICMEYDADPPEEEWYRSARSLPAVDDASSGLLKMPRKSTDDSATEAESLSKTIIDFFGDLDLTGKKTIDLHEAELSKLKSKKQNAESSIRVEYLTEELGKEKKLQDTILELLRNCLLDLMTSKGTFSSGKLDAIRNRMYSLGRYSLHSDCETSADNALALFERLGEYRDSKELARRCVARKADVNSASSEKQNAIRKKNEKSKKRNTAIIAAVVLIALAIGGFFYSKTVLIPDLNAKKLIGLVNDRSYKEATEYRNTLELSDKNKEAYCDALYQRMLIEYDNGESGKAYGLSNLLKYEYEGGYKDSEFYWTILEVKSFSSKNGLTELNQLNRWVKDYISKNPDSEHIGELQGEIDALNIDWIKQSIDAYYQYHASLKPEVHQFVCDYAGDYYKKLDSSEVTSLLRGKQAVNIDTSYYQFNEDGSVETRSNSFKSQTWDVNSNGTLSLKFKYDSKTYHYYTISIYDMGNGEYLFLNDKYDGAAANARKSDSIHGVYRIG